MEGTFSLPYGEYLLIVAGMGLVTYLPRWLPLALLSNRHLPKVAEAWLDLIPAAILSALLLPVLITGGQPVRLDFLRVELWAAIPTFLVAVLTRSMGVTVVLGMSIFWLLNKLL